MTQASMTVPDSSGAVLLTNVSNALAALASCSTGATAPAVTYPNMWWYDTTAGALKQRDNANSTWNIVPLTSIGVGQTWQDMTASRALATTYTNSTGKAIQLSIDTTNNSTGGTATFNINGTDIMVIQTAGATLRDTPIFAIIPPGQTYKLTNLSGTTVIAKWFELR